MAGEYDHLNRFRCKFEPMIPILVQTELENRRYLKEQEEWRTAYKAKMNKELDDWERQHAKR